MLLKIANGTVYDPTNGIDGVVATSGSATARSSPRRPTRTCAPDKVIDATGLVVMPGGVDMHSHIAGPKVNLARKMRPEDKRNAAGRAPHAADALRHDRQRAQHLRHRLPLRRHGLHHRLRRRHPAARRPPRPRGVPRHAASSTRASSSSSATTITSCEQIAAKEPERLRAFVAWLLDAGQGLRRQARQPRRRRGVEGRRRQHPRPRRQRRRTSASRRGRSSSSWPRRRWTCGLPHPVHIHCNNLGLPGNWQTTLDTMQALEGRRAHLTHIQFHSYGGDPDDQGTFCSQGARAGRVRQRPPQPDAWTSARCCSARRPR